jgi:hypothetical protein
MSIPNVPDEGAQPEGAEPSPKTDLTDPDEYGSLSVEDDPNGTVDPGELAGGADETDEDVS